MALTKEHIAKSIQHNNGLTKRKSTKVVDTILEIIKSALAGGEDIKIYEARIRVVAPPP